MSATMERQYVVTPANQVPGPSQGNWTYNHYAALPNDGQRYEIVDGVLLMAPSPGRSHQDAVLWIAHYLQIHVRLAGLGRVYIALFDVVLAPGVVVQPDVMVILNDESDKITPSRIVGAPSLVVEVSSPATIGYDRREKQNAYARTGVREYWIVHPGEQTIEVLSLEGGTYVSLGFCAKRDALVSRIVPTVSEVTAEQIFV
jgi:Uma2 family endonuclease